MTTYTGSVDTIKNKHIIISYKNKIVIEQYVLTYNVSNENATEIFRETLKFLYIRSISHQNILIPCKSVEQMWRLFIQDTKEYNNFCRYYLWKHIHHQFADSEDYSDRYQGTKHEIKKAFRNYAENIWEQSSIAQPKSLALKRDIINYQFQQPRIIKKSNPRAGYIELILIFMVIGIVIVLILSNLYIEE